MRKLFLFFLLVFSFNLFLKCQDILIQSKNDNTGTVFKSLENDEILSRLYDNFKIDSLGMVVWKPNYYESLSFPVSVDNFCHTAIDTIMYFIDREKRLCAAVILITYHFGRDYLEDSTKLVISDDHFAGARIGIALFFKNKKDNWELYKFEKQFATLGFFGGSNKTDLGAIKLLKVGDNWTCLSLREPIGGNGGIREGSESLYSIEEFYLGGFPNNVLSNVFNYDYYFSNIDDIYEKNKRFEKKHLKIIEKPGNYYDIEIEIKSGKKRIIEYYKFSEEEDYFILKSKLL